MMITGSLLACTLIAQDGDGSAETVALWLFDEPTGLYPSMSWMISQPMIIRWYWDWEEGLRKEYSAMRSPLPFMQTSNCQKVKRSLGFRKWKSWKGVEWHPLPGIMHSLQP